MIAMHTDSLRPCGNHARKLTAPKIQALGSKMGGMTHSAHEAMRSPNISMEPASWRYEPESPISRTEKHWTPLRDAPVPKKKTPACKDGTPTHQRMVGSIRQWRIHTRGQ